LSEIVRNIWFYSIQVPEAKEKDERKRKSVNFKQRKGVRKKLQSWRERGER
jgi:hypothetical protein